MSAKDLIQIIAIAVFVVLPIRLFVAQPFIVNGESMTPTFENNDYLIIDRLSYRFDEPKRGDVIVFKYPLDESRYFIKRIVGLPGEKVLVENSKVTIFNEEYPNGFKLEEPYVAFTRSDVIEMEVQNGEYFVMGDNRFASSDSRIWGTLPKYEIIGRVYLRLFPLNEVGILPGHNPSY